MKKRNLLLVSAAVVSFACLLMLHTSLAAQEGSARQSTPPNFRFQYSAKFFCTANIPGTLQTTCSFLPGVYQSVVYIHNPHNQTVQLRKKIAASIPCHQQPGPVSKFIPEQLGSDQALQVDCNGIQDFGLGFIHGTEGFLVIESTHSLDVNAAYTAGFGGEVKGITVERVRQRRIGVNEE